MKPKSDSQLFPQTYRYGFEKSKESALGLQITDTGTKCAENIEDNDEKRDGGEGDDDSDQTFVKEPYRPGRENECDSNKLSEDEEESKKKGVITAQEKGPWRKMDKNSMNLNNQSNSLMEPEEREADNNRVQNNSKVGRLNGGESDGLNSQEQDEVISMKKSIIRGNGVHRGFVCPGEVKEEGKRTIISFRKKIVIEVVRRNPSVQVDKSDHEKRVASTRKSKSHKESENIVRRKNIINSNNTRLASPADGFAVKRKETESEEKEEITEKEDSESEKELLFKESKERDAKNEVSPCASSEPGRNKSAKRGKLLPIGEKEIQGKVESCESHIPFDKNSGPVTSAPRKSCGLKAHPIEKFSSSRKTNCQKAKKKKATQKVSKQSRGGKTWKMKESARKGCACQGRIKNQSKKKRGRRMRERTQRDRRKHVRFKRYTPRLLRRNGPRHFHSSRKMCRKDAGRTDHCFKLRNTKGLPPHGKDGITLFLHSCSNFKVRSCPSDGSTEPGRPPGANNGCNGGESGRGSRPQKEDIWKQKGGFDSSNPNDGLRQNGGDETPDFTRHPYDNGVSTHATMCLTKPGGPCGQGGRVKMKPDPDKNPDGGTYPKPPCPGSVTEETVESGMSDRYNPQSVKTPSHCRYNDVQAEAQLKSLLNRENRENVAAFDEINKCLINCLSHQSDLDCPTCIMVESSLKHVGRCPHRRIMHCETGFCKVMGILLQYHTHTCILRDSGNTSSEMRDCGNFICLKLRQRVREEERGRGGTLAESTKSFEKLWRNTKVWEKIKKVLQHFYKLPVAGIGAGAGAGGGGGVGKAKTVENGPIGSLDFRSVSIVSHSVISTSSGMPFPIALQPGAPIPSAFNLIPGPKSPPSPPGPKSPQSPPSPKTQGPRSPPLFSKHSLPSLYKSPYQDGGPLLSPSEGEGYAPQVLYGSEDQLLRAVNEWMEVATGNSGIAAHQSEVGVILMDYRQKLQVKGGQYREGREWHCVAPLGAGMFGRCSLAADFETCHYFCVKQIPLEKFEVTEIEALAALDHPYICKLYGALHKGSCVYILLEFVQGCSLKEHIEAHGRLNGLTAMVFYKKLVEILIFLKHHRIIHEDIKSDNILLRSGTADLVLVDFGLAHIFKSNNPSPEELKDASPVGSQTQWSPEKAMCRGYTYEADLWASACVLNEMLSGFPPWIQRYSTATKLLFVIGMNSPPLEDIAADTPDDIRDLIVWLWTIDVRKRPTCSDVLQHRAFRIDEDHVRRIISTRNILPSGSQEPGRQINHNPAYTSQPNNYTYPQPNPNIDQTDTSLSSSTVSPKSLLENIKRTMTMSDRRKDEENKVYGVGMDPMSTTSNNQLTGSYGGGDSAQGGTGRGVHGSSPLKRLSAGDTVVTSVERLLPVESEPRTTTAGVIPDLSVFNSSSGGRSSGEDAGAGGDGGEEGGGGRRGREEGGGRGGGDGAGGGGRGERRISGSTGGLNSHEGSNGGESPHSSCSSISRPWATAPKSDKDIDEEMDDLMKETELRALHDGSFDCDDASW